MKAAKDSEKSPQPLGRLRGKAKDRNSDQPQSREGTAPSLQTPAPDPIPFTLDGSSNTPTLPNARPPTPETQSRVEGQANGSVIPDDDADEDSKDLVDPALKELNPGSPSKSTKSSKSRSRQNTGTFKTDENTPPALVGINPNRASPNEKDGASTSTLVARKARRIHNRGEWSSDDDNDYQSTIDGYSSSSFSTPPFVSPSPAPTVTTHATTPADSEYEDDNIVARRVDRDPRSIIGLKKLGAVPKAEHDFIDNPLRRTKATKRTSREIPAKANGKRKNTGDDDNDDNEGYSNSAKKRRN